MSNSIWLHFRSDLTVLLIQRELAGRPLDESHMNHSHDSRLKTETPTLTEHCPISSHHEGSKMQRLPSRHECFYYSWRKKNLTLAGGWQLELSLWEYIAFRLEAEYSNDKPVSYLTRTFSSYVKVIFVSLTKICETLHAVTAFWLPEQSSYFPLEYPPQKKSSLSTLVRGADSGVLKPLRQHRFPLLRTQSADSPHPNEADLVMSTLSANTDSNSPQWQPEHHPAPQCKATLNTLNKHTTHTLAPLQFRSCYYYSVKG